MDDMISIVPESALVAFSEPKGLDPFIDAVRKIVDEFEHDLSTATGRKKTASLAAKVSSFKVSLDDMGKGLTEEWKAKSKVVDQARKQMRDELDALRDRARAPLTEWENAEKQRVTNIKANIIRMNFSLNGMETLSYLESKLSEIESIKVDDSFEEFKIEALEIRGATIDMLKFAIGKAKIAEQERLELAKLRAEAEARAKADREESLRKEGEARAKREAEARIKAEQDKANAEKKMAIAESERKELEARRLADSQAKAVRDAEERAKNAEENARKKIEAEKAKREADENHVIEVKTAVYEAFISLGVPEQLAIDLINAIHAQNAGPVRLII